MNRLLTVLIGVAVVHAGHYITKRIINTDEVDDPPESAAPEKAETSESADTPAVTMEVTMTNASTLYGLTKDLDEITVSPDVSDTPTNYLSKVNVSTGDRKKFHVHDWNITGFVVGTRFGPVIVYVELNTDTLVLGTVSQCGSWLPDLKASNLRYYLNISDSIEAALAVPRG